jgi:hypothetical protein
MLRCGLPLVILKYMINECNPSTHNFDVAIAAASFGYFKITILVCIEFRSPVLVAARSKA